MKTSSTCSLMNELGTAAHMFDVLPERGNYTLVISLAGPVCIRISDLGKFSFRKGYYAYTGSAMGKGAVDLKHRVARHLRERKTMHWHIDYLLADPAARITAVVAFLTQVNEECQISRNIQSIEGASVPVDGFGASDCGKGCRSHLVYCGRDDALRKTVAVHRSIAKKAKVVCITFEPRDKQTGGKSAGNN